MKTHILSLCSFALAVAQPFAVQADGVETPLAAIRAANKSAPIPLDQLGAVAGKQYQGDGLSVTATPKGARLRCVFQRLEGEVTSEGLWLSSTAGKATSERFQVVASAIRRSQANEPGLAGTLALPGAGTVVVTERVARFIRPGLTEEYSVSMDGVRQDFIVGQRPVGDGPLRVELDVAGAKAESLVNGARLTLDGSGRKVAYNRLRVVDAQGRELTARLVVECDANVQFEESFSPDNASGPDSATASVVRDSVLDCGSPLPLWHTAEPTKSGRGLPRSKSLRSTARLAVIVDDADALYPIRIDPTFSDANWISMGTVPGADESVYAAVVDGAGNLYIGGAFTIVGDVVANGVARWNGSGWSALGSGMNDNVFALAVNGTDLYAGGWFTTAGGTPVNYITRWNGSAWSALGSGMNDVVSALAVSGTDVYAGGGFTYATNPGPNAVSVNYIARWDGSSWSALGSGMSDVVSALAVSGTSLYAGGGFTYATNAGSSAVSVNYIARWDGSAWSALGLGMSDGVSALAVWGTSLYAGGWFTYATNAGPSAVNVNCIARWDGSAWSALGSGMDSSVAALVVSGTDLYVGGYFTYATNAGQSAVSVNYIAKWDGAAWSSLGSGMDSEVYALVVSGTDLYAGGLFTYAMNAGPSAVNVNYVARWNGSTWSALGADSGINYGVNALAVSGTDLYVGGSFTAAGGSAANHIARWNGNVWSSLGVGMDRTVYALVVSGTNLYAGGDFTTAGGTAATNIARWDGSTWSALGSGMDASVYALAVSGTNLYAGGHFTTAGGIPATSIAKWDGSAWWALGSGMSFSGGPYGRVFALAVSGTNLYAGGDFTTAGETEANYVAKWDGSAWSALGSGMSGRVGPIYGCVFALGVSGTSLYAGGCFTNAGGVGATNVAKWNGSAWSALGSGMSRNYPFYGLVYALAVSGTNLYAGGFFTSAGGVPANYIARWDGSAWSALGSGMGGAVLTLAVSGSDLYVGGGFTTAGNKVSTYLARAIIGTAGGRFSSGRYSPTTGFSCTFSDATAGQPYRIQKSPSLAAGSWTDLTNFTYPGPIAITDSSVATSNRFYRAVTP